MDKRHIYMEKVDGRNADDDWNIPALNRRNIRVNLPTLGPYILVTPR